jgi:predicted CXXCH cytochrome family protein
VTKTALVERIKGVFPTKHRRSGVVLIVLAIAFLHLPVQAADFKICDDCHKEVLEAVFRTYIHLPFQQQRCGECHDARGPSALPDKNVVSLKDRRKITWLGESSMADTRHGFVLPDERVGGALIVEAQGSNGIFARQEISVPSLPGLSEVQNSGKPPVISDVRVLKVQRVVFLSATISWQTDTLTNALVRYGDGDLSQSSQSGNRFGRRHQVTLYNLKPDRTYRFSVVSKDLFGRSQASEPSTFSTARSFDATPPAAAGDSPSGAEDGMTGRFQRLGTDYLLELTLKQPSTVFVGTRAETRPRSPDQTGRDDIYHASLSSKQVVTMEACRSCHKNQTTATHPVNVYPKPGMIIPPEYPTLPDGRITCRSCHESHGSDNEFLTVKGGKRELCVGCHRDMM